MVEGPGTTRNGIKAEQLIGQKVLNIITSKGVHNPWWNNRKLSQVVKIGKELFLIFALIDEIQIEEQEQKAPSHDLALRLHFGMVGSLHVNNHGTQTRQYKGRQPDMPTLEITFESKLLRTYDTTISIPINAIAPRTKYQRLHTFDCCSDDFSLDNVVQNLMSPSLSISRDTVISDVLLDQNLCPGFGNVIKVEGMHQARIHPKRPLSSLNEEELRLVVDKCQKYAMRWFREGRAPTKAVYNQTTCGTCHKVSVRICRVGGSNRTTFWCMHCQPMNPNALQQNSVATSQNIPNGIKRACPTHGPANVMLRRCKKSGMNEQRIFYCCKKSNCRFFSWADTNFPMCKCKKRAVLRVSKTDKTGGRWFFFCAKRGPTANGCGYFEWANQKYLDSYGQLLTPLL